MASIWQNSVKMPQFPELSGEHKTDVLIIGGGLTGILTAYFLTQNGVACILLEKSRIAGGTSGNTTAKISVQHGLIYSQLLKREGLHTASDYLNANRLAFQKFEEICPKIACDFEYKDSYIYSLRNRECLENELSALEKIGCPAQFCNTVSLPVPASGAVKIPRQAQFHPLKCIAAVAKDLPIYENSHVLEMRGNTAVTNKGTVSAETVIAATHFPFINKHGFYFLKLYQNRSYVIALENAQEVNGIYRDENETGLSFRNYGKYLLIGGGSHRTGKKGGGWEELRHFARLHYPKARECFHWAAQDCMSLDKLPYIGQYSSRTTRFYTASGFNKWGMTGSMLAAMLLSDRIIGRDNPFAETFRPSRSILKPQLFVNAWESAVHLLNPSPKRCPHMGCALKWNNAEHSWDCPCHGSRFDKGGRVLNNPANGDLRSGRLQ